MISVVPFAFADSHDIGPVHTSSDLDIYTNGLDVVITGSLKNYDPLTYDKVSYTVISPENNIVKIGQIIPNSDGTFEFSFKAGGSLFKSSGDYIVKTNYGGNTHELAINYVGGESPEPCAANETRVDGVCKPTEVTPEPVAQVTDNASGKQGMSITATADKGSDSIMLMGQTVSDITDVNFKVTSPSGNNVVDIGQISPDRDGNFAVELKIGKFWDEDGFYTITAMQSVIQNSFYTLSVEVEVIDGKTSQTFVTDSDLENSFDNSITDKGITMQAKALESNLIEITGTTDKTSRGITVTVVAPNGNVVSIIQITPMLNGEFTYVIEIMNNSLWKQNGIYTITAQQFDSPKYNVSSEIEIKDKSALPITEPIPELINNTEENFEDENKISSLEYEISEIKKDNISLKVENRKLNNNNNVLQTQIDELNLKVINLQNIINEQINVILQVIQDLTDK